MKKFEHFKANLKVLVTAEKEDLSNEFILGGIHFRNRFSKNDFKKSIYDF